MRRGCSEQPTAIWTTSYTLSNGPDRLFLVHQESVSKRASVKSFSGTRMSCCPMRLKPKQCFVQPEHIIRHDFSVDRILLDRVDTSWSVFIDSVRPLSESASLPCFYDNNYSMELLLSGRTTHAIEWHKVDRGVIDNEWFQVIGSAASGLISSYVKTSFPENPVCRQTRVILHIEASLTGVSSMSPGSLSRRLIIRAR